MAKRIVLIAAVVMLIGMAMSAHAMAYNSILTGTLGNVNVNATATLTGGIWDYVYVVSPTNVPALNGQLHSFSIGNPGLFPYFGTASSDPTFTWASTLVDTVRWENGLPTSSPVTFSFKSIYEPGYVDCSAQNGGHASTGKTLGMVPEPISMILGSLGLCCVAGLKRLRRK
ncbi:MAG: hypothetical protein ABFD83_01625 [Armatimonadota bacterium]